MPRVPKSVEAVSSYVRGMFHSIMAQKKTRKTEPKVQQAMDKLRRDGVEITKPPEVQAFDQARRGAILLKRANRAAQRANLLIRWLSRRMKWAERSTEVNASRAPKTPRGRIRRKIEGSVRESIRGGYNMVGFRFRDASGDHYVLDADAVHDGPETAIRAVLAHELEHMTQPWIEKKTDPKAFWHAFPNNEVMAFGAEARALGTDSAPTFLWITPWNPPPGYHADRLNTHMIQRYIERVAEVVTPLTRGAPAEHLALLGRYFDGYRAGLKLNLRYFEEVARDQSSNRKRGWVKRTWDALQGKRFERKWRRFEQWATQWQEQERLSTPEQAYRAGEWDATSHLAPHPRAKALLQAIEHRASVTHSPRE